MAQLYGAQTTRGLFDARIARVAAGQHGVFSRRQATALGATRSMIGHRLRTGRWEPAASDVFRLSGTAPSWMQGVLIASIAWGVGAVISHRSAAAIWRFAGFGPGPVELTVPLRRRRAGPGLVHRYRLSRSDVTMVEGVLVTPARTLLDLAAVAPIEAVEEALDDALRRGIVTISTLRRKVAHEARPGRRGIASMRKLLDGRDPSLAVPDSVLERRLLRTVFSAGLPAPVAQYEVRTRGRLVAVLDFAYPEKRLAIEADGYRWHSGRVRWDHDRVRRNQLTLLGWRIIHVTWTDLTRRPGTVATAIRSALGEGRP